MDCFITRRGYVNSGGSSSKVTPEKLGYVSGASAFLMADGTPLTDMFPMVHCGLIWFTKRAPIEFLWEILKLRTTLMRITTLSQP